MNEMKTENRFAPMLKAQKDFFRRGETLRVDYRICALQRLKKALLAREGELNAALKADLNKSPDESYATETGMVLHELNFALSHLRGWAAPRLRPTSLSQFPAMGRVRPTPFGCSLIISPWNYPFHLAMVPLVSALAAGNTAVVKPSEDTPHVAEFIADLVAEVFPPEYVTVVRGHREVNLALLELPFDKIFFTGSPAVGRVVMEKAAAHLASVTLELGGKSPCIVDEKADLPLAARRIAFGKILNAGQTCVAPDYVLVHERVKEEFLELLREEFRRQLGETPLENEDYVRIVNEKHFERIGGLCEGQNIYCGGGRDPERLKMEPTVLVDVAPDSPVMQEEIFGPVLPVLTWRSWEEARSIIERNPEPLALYLFTEDKGLRGRVLTEVTSGGACINDVVVHLATPHMPFGGVGNSGLGCCHGKAGFDAFTHHRSVLYRGKLDLSMRYQPYNEGKARLVRMFLK